jgi:hypothetical protein
MLTLGWSDGFSFAPLDFVMLTSAKLENRFCEMKENLRKHSQGYKRRLEAFSRKPDAVVNLIDRALATGFSADFVLMDSWFTQAPLLRSLLGKGPLGSVNVETACGLPVKLVFVQNRNRRREWLVVLSTDLSLDDTEIIRIYGMRWGIETFFKFTKSHLKLGKEFQGRSFDLLVSHTTIVFSRYLVME